MNDPLQALRDAIAAQDDARAEIAALAVGRLSDRVIPELLDMLQSGQRDHRWWAVRTLAAVGTPPAAEALVTALEDPDPDVRACAVVGLADLRPSTAILPLVNCLSDPSAYVARLAADALGRFGNKATQALISALNEGDIPTRAGAARALRAIQPEEAIPALYAALDDPSMVVTHYAQEALERMGVGLVLFQP